MKSSNIKKMKNVGGKDDCYFFYYSSCKEGDRCKFRHEPAAMHNEKMCIHWLKGSCTKPHCPFKHLKINKNRSKIECYHESQPSGCLKENCPFAHKYKENLSQGDDDLTTNPLDSNGGSGTASDQKIQKPFGLSQFKLIKSLSEFPEFSATVSILEERFGHSPSRVKSIAAEYDALFHLSGEAISLRPQIDVCQEYLSQSGCQAVVGTQERCNDLHVCREYLMERCADQDCLLGHSLSTQHNKSVLDSLSLGRLSHNLLFRLFTENVFAAPVKTKSAPKTLWAHDYCGEAAKSEICYDSVESYCANEKSGCDRLHCVLHFYWQIRSPSSDDNFWVNLTKEQAIALERDYCDPDIVQTTLLQLDPAALPSHLRGLLAILNGKSKWTVNFKSMRLHLEGQANGVGLRRLLHLEGQANGIELRRLITERTEKAQLDPSKFAWYFHDKNGVWIEYGKTDSTGEDNLKVSVSSSAIEKAYKENPASPVSVQSQSFIYHLNFQTMVQRNMKTGVTREMRRRPVPHLKAEPTTLPMNLPDSWVAMKPNQRFLVVNLLPTDQEYVKIAAHLRNNGAAAFRVLKIGRIQNPYLYRAFRNKVEEMVALYSSEAAVNVRQLFHGTSADIVPKIYEENFDWRLHGSNSGQAFGRGTYFSSSAQYSNKYSKSDAKGEKFMFVARVAIGSVTLGNPSMARPPINPQTNLPFDSTVDKTAQPLIVVKYDKQEYFRSTL